MSEDNCAVYMHVNLINGKKYIGVTTQEPEMRWRNGNGYYSNTHFMSAIRKYHWENFAHYVLYRNIPIKIAKNIEEMLIKEYMSYDRRYGYNKTYGGELEIPSEETREKLSKNNPMKQPEVAAKIGRALSERFKNNPELLPRPPKPVEAVDLKTGRVVHRFKSTRDAGRAGFDQGTVAKCCNRKPGYKTHKGYIWRYVNEEVNDDDGDN